ncbi:hypothetical protein KP509_13G000900 [Ceratopteris richardii]|nr:hypothetical protein KP509_13G000900 [Ceratopteris richardii]
MSVLLRVIQKKEKKEKKEKGILIERCFKSLFNCIIPALKIEGNALNVKVKVRCAFSSWRCDTEFAGSSLSYGVLRVKGFLQLLVISNLMSMKRPLIIW